MTRIDPAIQWLNTHVNQGEAILCATSGGLDSMCLAHLLTHLGYAITVAHYHHGLREQADEDAAFVEGWCKAQNVPFVMECGDVSGYGKAHGLGIEEAGRILRYDFLHRTATACDCPWIATAHHGDDNVETMLLNLCRGTGLAGLCGIPSVSGKVIRPLLGVSRADLEAYAKVEGIAHIIDHTNDDTAFSRNRLRHQVLPVLQTINPQVVAHFSQTAGILSQEQDYLAAKAAALPRQETPDGLTMAWGTIQANPVLAHRAIHQMICHVAGKSRDITAQHVASVLALQGSGGQVSLPYGVVARATSAAVMVEKTLPLPGQTPLVLGQAQMFGKYEVVLSRAPMGAESQVIHLPQGGLTITPWQPQDRMGSRSLKRRFIDCAVALAERDTLPVVRCNGQVVAVSKVGIHPDFVTLREGTSRFYITFTYKGE